MSQGVVVDNPTKSRRILSFDLIRGYFLLVILIDHIELYPSGWDFLTGKGRLFVSAAEGFFFMSGLLVGMVYKRRLDKGMKFIFYKMWLRALELYLAAIFFTLFYTAAALFLNHPSIKDGIYGVTDWGQIFRHALIGQYVYGWADFLIHFAILMFLAPFGFYLLAKGKWWLLLALSTIGWIFRGQDFTLAWQIIFSMGMVVGFYWHQMESWWSRLALRTKKQIITTVASVAALSFALSYASVYVLSPLNQYWSHLPTSLQSITGHWNNFNAWFWQFTQKWTMGPMRIVLFTFWFSALFIWVRRHEHKINRRTFYILELLGTNSLFVYIAHSFIVFGFKLFIPTRTNFLINFSITTAALALLVGSTVLYKKLTAPEQLPMVFQKPSKFFAKYRAAG